MLSDLNATKLPETFEGESKAISEIGNDQYAGSWMTKDLLERH